MIDITFSKSLLWLLLNTKAHYTKANPNFEFLFRVPEHRLWSRKTGAKLKVNSLLVLSKWPLMAVLGGRVMETSLPSRRENN